MLAKPKGAYKPKEQTQDEIERKRQRLDELSSRKRRYEKFDFADYVNRDQSPRSPPTGVPGQFKSRYDDLVPPTLYQAGNKIAQQRMERQKKKEKELLELQQKKQEEENARPPEPVFDVGLKIGEHMRQSSESSLPVKSRKQSSNNLLKSVNAGVQKRFNDNLDLKKSILDESDVIADKQKKQKYSSLEILRKLEFQSAVKIQTKVRAYFTRKWYVNLQVRKKLSVPFSGMEFAQNPFLRQFNKINQRLQAGKTNVIAEIINLQKMDQRNMIETKPKNRKVDPLLQNKQRENEIKNQIQVKSLTPIKRISKGVSAEKLLEELKQDFIEQGLDAYQQFKRLGVGIDFNDQGQAYSEGGIQKVRKWIEERVTRRNYVGGDGTNEGQEMGEIDPQKTEITETQQYLDKAQARKQGVKDETGAAENQTRITRQMQLDGVISASNQIKMQEDIPIQQYQEYSREAIVFFKNLGLGYSDNLIKWVVYAGSAFEKNGKLFMPLKIIGKPVKSRSTVVIYTMNLEMIRVSRASVENYNFETIWPFILYLFNSWVRHQVTLMGIKRILPGLEDRLPDSNYTLYECHNELKQDFDALADEAYKDILNFSSEIELDDRFDKPEIPTDVVIDRSKPEQFRKTVREDQKDRRLQLFNQYKNSVARAIDQQEKQLTLEAGRKFVTFNEKLIDNMTLEEQLNIMGENKEAEQKFIVNQKDVDAFKTFLGAHYVRLPKPESNQYKLMMNLQKTVYHLMEKKGGLSSLQIALMNEERRRIKQLPALKSIDYNCIDRAAIKLRLILDCLEIVRKFSGTALVPRDLKRQQRNADYAVKRQKIYQQVIKKDNFSYQIQKHMGKTVIYEQDYKGVSLKMEDPKKLRLKKRLSRIPVLEDDDPTDEEEDLFQSVIQQDFQQPEISNIFRRENTNLDSIVLPASIIDTQQTRKTIFAEQLERTSKLKIQIKIEKYEIETVISEDQLLEQGCLRFQNKLYISGTFFRKIHCNLDNMTILMRKKRFKYKKSKDIMDKREEETRLVSKPCAIVSSHPAVLERDEEFVNGNQVKSNDYVELQLEMHSRVWTKFQSFVEIKMCTRLSSSLWHDSVQITWEQLSQFFSFFGVRWDPIQFLKRQKFNQAEAFLFYNFFAECLDVDPDDQVSLTFSLDRLLEIKHKYDMIFLRLQEFIWIQRQTNLGFYYPDILLQTNFNECNFDVLNYPYMQDPQLSHYRILNIPRLQDFYFGVLEKNDFSKRLEIKQDFVDGEKPDILVDDFTREYLEDPQALFNLTLSKYPANDTLFLGCLQLGNQKIQYEAPITYTSASKRTKAQLISKTKTKFNVRIDYYVKGVVPNLHIRAFTRLASQGGGTLEILSTIIQTPKIIKDFIRICGQNSNSMVLNQLQSILAIEQHNTGRRLILNHQSVRQRRQKSSEQDIYTMLVVNETNLRSRVGSHNTFKFKGILNLRNVSSGFSSVLACVTQYDFQTELIQHHGDVMMKIVHGNKHLTQQMIQKNRESMILKCLELDPNTNLKVFTAITMWKVSLMDMRKSQKYDAILTQEDLREYYECEVFDFFKNNPTVSMPDILELLKQYLLNLFNFRTQVGVTLAWSLPLYKVQLDSFGRPMVFDAEQAYQVPRLILYQHLQTIRNSQLQFEDDNKLPVSLDAHRKTRKTKGLPKLCLRTRLAIEKVLPIYQIDDLKALKISSNQYRVICQVTKIFNKLSDFHFAVVTVTLHELMETWIWTIYFPSTQRTFMVTFYASDLYKLDQKIFKEQNVDERTLWTKIVQQSKLQLNQMGDVLLRVDSFTEPVREMLYQTYAYNDQSKDLYYQELTLRSYSNYVTDISKSLPPINLKDPTACQDFTISFRAFSLGKEQWIKDYQPLTEVIKLLQQENLLTEDLRSFYYSMIKNAAVLLASKVVMFTTSGSDAEVKKRKVTYNVQKILNSKTYRTNNDKGDPIIYAGLKPTLKSDWQNLIQLNRVIYQAVVANNPTQLCSISYNEAKDRFVYRLYRTTDCASIERRFDGNEIQRTCCPYYLQMLRNKMEKELGQRIAQFYHANILVASVLQIHNLNDLIFPSSLNPEVSV